MRDLVERLFRRHFASPQLEEAHDGARLALRGRVAVTADAFTVRPRFFPGGDLGSLAVHGIVNDLAMCGARARHLTVCALLEEGLAMHELERIVRSLARTAREAGVDVVCGDTKVVERGKGDGVFLALTGLGELLEGADLAPRRVLSGDAILLSGPIGEHGTAVMLAREGLAVPPGLVSDSARVDGPALGLVRAGIDVHCMRDVTRGGLAAVLHEIASTARLSACIDERAIPVRPEVADACELLGLDPLHVACEGRFVAFVAEPDAARALDVMRAFGVSVGALRIGTMSDGSVNAGSVNAGSVSGGSVSAGSVSADSVSGGSVCPVVLRTALGGERVVDLPAGDPMPRIC
jgi:hydrogenase expression/formation protein HypE